MDGWKFIIILLLLVYMLYSPAYMSVYYYHITTYHHYARVLKILLKSPKMTVTWLFLATWIDHFFRRGYAIGKRRVPKILLN
jgi:hypothetical protein